MNKFFLKSKTVIGIIVSILPALLPQIGISFSVADGVLVSSTVDLVVQGLGAVLAMYGRFDAGGMSVKPGGELT